MTAAGVNWGEEMGEDNKVGVSTEVTPLVTPPPQEQYPLCSESTAVTDLTPVGSLHT